MKRLALVLCAAALAGCATAGISFSIPIGGSGQLPRSADTPASAPR
jgi:hypothetical protein